MDRNTVAKLARKKQAALQALQQKDFGRAETLLRQVCKGNAKDAQAWFLLGAVYGEGGKFEQVIDCCRRVLALDPNNVPAYTNLGNASASLGRHEEAAAAYAKALERAPDDLGVLYNYGRALSLAGRHEETVECLRRVVAKRLNFPDAHFLLANAYVALGRNEEALPHYQQAVTQAPDSFPSRLEYARLLNALGLLRPAEVEGRAALRLRPDSMEAMLCLSAILGFSGKYDEAIEMCDRVLQISPGDPVALTGKAELYEHNGEKATAYELLRQLIDENRMIPSCASIYARLCSEYGDCEEAIGLCRTFAVRPDVAPTARQDILFSLGKLFDRLGRYDEAFDTYAEANDLERAAFDREKLSDRIDCLIAAFGADVWEELPRATVSSQRPTFIVGMPRSGTSLVEQILASHPQVFGAGELPVVGDLVRALPPTLYPQSMATADRERLDGLARQYLAGLDELDQEALRVTDKMPHNFFHLGLIAMLFPEARIIHCKRDPRDTCLSIFFQRFNLAHTYASDLRNLGLFYREYLRMMAHWQEVLPLPILDVQYEELIAEPERVSRELVAFCGLEWDERCLRFHEIQRSVATASYDQVRRPIYKGSIGRWRRYEAHLGPLLEALGPEPLGG